MNDICVKLGVPANDVQQYGIKDIYTQKIAHIYNVPVKNQDKFEKLLDESYNESLKLGTTKEEITKNTTQRLSSHTTIGGLLGLTSGLLIGRKKSNLKTFAYTTFATTFGLLAGATSAVLPLPGLKVMFNSVKADKLAVSHYFIPQNTPQLKLELPNSQPKEQTPEEN